MSAVNLADVLDPTRVVLLNQQLKEDVLAALVDILATAPEVRDRDELMREILHREELMSTGIGGGLGVPHVRLDSVDNLVMAMAVNEQPILNYEALDDEPVRIVCMIAAASGQHKQYIKTLAAISQQLKDPTTREQVLAAEVPETVHTLMTTGPAS